MLRTCHDIIPNRGLASLYIIALNHICSDSPALDCVVQFVLSMVQKYSVTHVYLLVRTGKQPCAHPKILIASGPAHLTNQIKGCLPVPHKITSSSDVISLHRLVHPARNKSAHLGDNSTKLAPCAIPKSETASLRATSQKATAPPVTAGLAVALRGTADYTFFLTAPEIARFGSFLLRSIPSC